MMIKVVSHIQLNAVSICFIKMFNAESFSCNCCYNILKIL